MTSNPRDLTSFVFQPSLSAEIDLRDSGQFEVPATQPSSAKAQSKVEGYPVAN